jgi:hypothetical protein
MKSTLLAVALLLCGCAAHTIHPGTANAFDSGAYDTLMLADSSIQSAKNDLTANQVPAGQVPVFKSALNALIDAYNTADGIYCGMPVTGSSPGTLVCAPTSYHAMAIAGTASAADAANLQNAMNQVTSASSSLASAKGGT